MNILVDIIHPAHVHFFRHAIDQWRRRGHRVAVTARRKDVTIELLDNFGIEYTTLSTVGRGLPGLMCELVLRDVRLWKFCRKFRPDVLTGISGVFIAHVGRLMGAPSVVWDDTEHQHLAHKITWPFATAIYSPQSYRKLPVKKQHLYAGCHELAYLHPNHFTPDAQVVRGLGIDPESRYCVIRFVSWGAHHDVGQRGFADNMKLHFVKEIERYARPYITSEGDLPVELKPYQLSIPPHQLHHVLAFSSLCVAEGATVASEAALLAVPAIYINTLEAGTIDRLEQTPLLKQITDTQLALEASLAILRDEHSRDKCRTARDELLAKEIDVTEFVVETIEKYGGKTQR